MRSFITLGVFGIALASTSMALAHSTPWSWKPARAAQMVMSDVAVQLPASERAALEAEIRSARSKYVLEEMIANDEGDWFAAGMYANLISRLTKALDKIEKGFGVDSARCTGLGRAAKGRYKHFRCSVTSQVVEIPTVASIEREGDKQFVVEGPPRVVGPFQAEFDVHVRGKSSLSYRPL